MSTPSRLCICGQTIPFTCVVDGKKRNLKNRKFCLACSPFGLHNTRDIAKPRPDPMERFRRYQERERRERKAKLVELLGGHAASPAATASALPRLSFTTATRTKSISRCPKRTCFKKWPVILAEAEKCDLYCANCHRELEDALRGESAED